jgi:integrase
MPRKAAGLTAAGVRTKPPGRYGDGGGLYLLVRSAEARSWLFRYTRDGKMREMGLGPASGKGAVPLADQPQRENHPFIEGARTKARRLYEAVRGGRDPLADREAAEAAAKAEAQAAAVRAMTFREVAAAYIAAHEASWRNAKHRQQWENTLRGYAFPKIGETSIADVDTAGVMAVLEPIWHEKAETASRLRGRIEVVLDYAKARSWRTGENPARWRGHIGNMLPKRSKVARVEHHAALDWREIGDFLVALRAQDGLAASALLVTILTAARTSEVLNSTWPEFDLDSAVWIVPADRMKAAKEHRVPLSAAAVKLLGSLLTLRDKDAGDWVFPGSRAKRPLSNMAMLMLLRRMNRADLTAHGFRSTFRDWAGETGQPSDIAEAALAHTLGNKVQAAYQRGDLLARRRKLMDDWAEFSARGASQLAPGER